ncbi:MAG: ATP-binding protein [Pseudomonadota bacterium]
MGDLLNALPNPVLMLSDDDRILFCNIMAEDFFRSGRQMLIKQRLQDLVPFGSPLLSLVAQARERQSPVNEYRVDIGTPQVGMDRIVDAHAAPIHPDGRVISLMLQERTMADKIARQLNHRGAARSVTGLAAMLAHEIKNPLSGIRGAAQLLEPSVSPDDRSLTQLIRDEADRIVRLVDRMEVFSDERPIAFEPVNMHTVLEHVKRVAQSGFASSIRFQEAYDPSLPPVWGNRDQLIQAVLNLVKNSTEALADTNYEPEITLQSAFRPGVYLTVPGAKERVSLPLEFSVIDNGPGFPPELEPHLFDPFVTSKTSGSGLGLALVSKIVGAHGGVIECETQPRRTVFKILLPMDRSATDRAMETD